MEKTISILNQMQTEGLFEKYAIGGGIAALFYIEPITTFDLDVFVILPSTSQLLISLTPIYTWLEKRGFRAEKEQIIIEGVPVQFIPVYNELIKEAVLNAVEKKYGTTNTRVLLPEYLMAIMLQTSRPKDKERLLKFIETVDIAVDLFNSILIRYGLKEKYENLKDIFNGK
ncbi:hypothetical protein JW964_22555 [candidate division KSB1 bacterium]|nr:hypothetical protein [candidate division KSB1 bacterium]